MLSPGLRQGPKCCDWLVIRGCKPSSRVSAKHCNMGEGSTLSVNSLDWCAAISDVEQSRGAPCGSLSSTVSAHRCLVASAALRDPIWEVNACSRTSPAGKVIQDSGLTRLWNGTVLSLKPRGRVECESRERVPLGAAVEGCSEASQAPKGTLDVAGQGPSAAQRSCLARTNPCRHCADTRARLGACPGLLRDRDLPNHYTRAAPQLAASGSSRSVYRHLVTIIQLHVTSGAGQLPSCLLRDFGRPFQDQFGHRDKLTLSLGAQSSAAPSSASSRIAPGSLSGLEKWLDCQCPQTLSHRIDVTVFVLAEFGPLFASVTGTRLCAKV